MIVHQQLPTHNVPKQAETLAAQPRLRIDGLVAQQRIITPADLAHLPRHSFAEDFYCEQHWVTPDQRWRGPRLLDVLQLAQPLPAARFVRVHAGNYVVPLSLAEAELALLAESLNEQPLAVEHGAPWRLALAGAACFTSVKWVDRLELSNEPGENVGERISLARRRIQEKRAPAAANDVDAQPRRA